MANNLSFKSFYYSLGTTSFRMKNFNQKIEEQLSLLDRFWKKEEYKNEMWENNEILQEAYYNFIKENGFLKDGEAPRKAKDARQKTSGMKDIGLIYQDRRLTPVGEKLLEISQKGDFKSDNFLQIPKDSFIYFQQLLKTSFIIKDSPIRPFVLLSRLLKKFVFLSKDEFMYLFPLCIDKTTTSFIENQIEKYRGKKLFIDETITSIFMEQDNYRDALQLFLEKEKLDENTFCEIGLNRKSREYDKPYFPLYLALKKVYFDGDKSKKAIIDLYELSNISNVNTHWRKLLFNTSSSAAVKKSPFEKLFLENIFSNCKSEKEFRKIFFKTMHLIKTKKSLEDYYDLNRRYLKIADVLLFSDNQVKFDVVPKYYFSLLEDEFYELAFEPSDKLTELTSLEDISPFLKLDEKKLLRIINKDNNTAFNNIGNIKKFVADERTERFNRLIDERFSDKVLIKILELFKKRKGPSDDKEIQALVTDEADGPTIFEYILAIVWYKINEKKGDILSFMNLSLEADLLPKTHAGGGEADIIWKYSRSDDYPKHDLLIEATLSESTNQRRMEIEPVSRHLGDYILLHKEYETYCLFITNYLHINVIADFRNRQTYTHYNDKGDFIKGMMITPVETDILIAILKSGLKYSQLYKIFHEHHKSKSEPKEWYKELVKSFAI